MRWALIPILLVLLGLPPGASLAAPSGKEIRRPAVVTEPATVESDHSIALEATIYPKGRELWIWFDIGMTKRYERMTEPTTDEGRGVFGPETGLTQFFCRFRPSTVYHFRAVVKDGAGKAYGRDRTVRTPRRNPSFCPEGYPPIIRPPGSTAIG